MTLLKNRSVLLVSLFGFFLIIIFISTIPYRTTVVPEWEISVVDKTGKPLENINVRQYWQHCSLEEDGHEEIRTTNQDGKVLFPQRTIRANAAQRLIGPIHQFLTSLFEAGYGPHSWVIAINNGEKGTIRYWRDKPLERTMVINAQIRNN